MTKFINNPFGALFGFLMALTIALAFAFAGPVFADPGCGNCNGNNGGGLGNIGQNNGGGGSGNLHGSVEFGSGGTWSQSGSVAGSIGGSIGDGKGSSQVEFGAMNFAGAQNTFKQNGGTSETISESATYGDFKNKDQAAGGGASGATGDAWAGTKFFGGKLNWGWNN